MAAPSAAGAVALLAAMALAGCQGAPSLGPGDLVLDSPDTTRTVFEGQKLLLAFTVHNAGSVAADVVFEGQGTPELPVGGVEPANLSLAPNGTADAVATFGPAAAMLPGETRHAGEVAVRAMVGGQALATRTWGVQERAAVLSLRALQPSARAAPGTRVTFPIVMENSGTEALAVTLGLPAESPASATGIPAVVTLAAHGNGGAFVTFDLRNTSLAPGNHTLRVVGAVDGAPAATVDLALELAAPQHPALPADDVTVDYVGRYVNGTVFDTSLAEVAHGPFLAVPGLAGHAAFRPLATRLVAGGGTITGFWQALVGMDVNQSKTVALEPWEAYGNASSSIDFPRHQNVPRASEPLPRDVTFPRANLEGAGYLNASSAAGDLVLLPNPAGGGLRAFRITSLDNTTAVLRWEVAVGDNETLYPAWPHQSRAVEVNETHASFVTTPAELGVPITWFVFWPNMTRLVAMNDTTLTIEHTPTLNLTFTLPSSTTRRNATVVAVNETSVNLRVPNENALAGQRLVFDLILRSARRPGA